MASACFVCGGEDNGKAVLNLLLTRPGFLPAPFFPFLERHPKPDDAEPPGDDGAVKGSSCSNISGGSSTE